MPTWPLAVLLVYFAPTLIGAMNRQGNTREMFFANLMLGFLAWPVLMMAALMPPAE